MIGIRMQLFDDETPLVNIAGIHAAFWDATEVQFMEAPTGRSVSLETDSNGFLSIDLSDVSALESGDFGFLVLYRPDAVYNDSPMFIGKIKTSNITSGDKLY